MPTLAETRFQRYIFSDDEDKICRVFTDLNHKHIQTELCTATENKMLIAFVPDSPNAHQEFLGEHEYWRGYCAALMALLTMHQNAVDLLEQESRSEPSFNFENRE